MQPEKLIELVKASEHGLSKTEAAERTDIPYRTVLVYAKKYNLTFACGKKIAHARYRETKHHEDLQRQQLKRLGSYGPKLQTLADTYRSSKESGKIQSGSATRGIRGPTIHNRSALEEKLRVKLSQAKTKSQREDVIYWFKWYCHEKDLIKRKKRPPFPRMEREDWEHRNFAKRESIARRGRILDALSTKPQTANQISSITGFDLRSTSLFMHNLFREGKVDRKTITAPKDKKNKVYLYTDTGS